MQIDSGLKGKLMAILTESYRQLKTEGPENDYLGLDWARKCGYMQASVEKMMELLASAGETRGGRNEKDDIYRDPYGYRHIADMHNRQEDLPELGGDSLYDGDDAHDNEPELREEPARTAGKRRGRKPRAKDPNEDDLK